MALCIGSGLPHNGMHGVAGPRGGGCGHQDSIQPTVVLSTGLAWSRGDAEKREPIYDSIVHHHPVRECAIILTGSASHAGGRCTQDGRKDISSIAISAEVDYGIDSS